MLQAGVAFLRLLVGEKLRSPFFCLGAKQSFRLLQIDNAICYHDDGYVKRWFDITYKHRGPL